LGASKSSKENPLIANSPQEVTSPNNKPQVCVMATKENIQELEVDTSPSRIHKREIKKTLDMHFKGMPLDGNMEHGTPLLSEKLDGENVIVPHCGLGKNRKFESMS
jgi:hypothetical protein